MITPGQANREICTSLRFRDVYGVHTYIHASIFLFVEKQRTWLTATKSIPGILKGNLSTFKVLNIN